MKPRLKLQFERPSQAIPNEYLSQLISSANVMIVGLNHTGHIVLANKAVEQVTGYSADALRGMDYFDKIVPKNRYPEVWQAFQDYLKSRQEILSSIIHPILTQSGEERLVSWQHNAPASTDDKIATLSFGIDITDHTLINKELILLNFAMSHIAEAVFLIDADSNIQFANEAACLLFGYTRQELLTLQVLDLNPFTSMERWRYYWTELKSRQAIIQEGLLKKKNGQIFPAEMYSNHFNYEGKGYNLALVRDITERKQAEEELAKKEREYRSLVENTPDFIVRHDLELRRIYTNPAWRQSSGFTNEEVINIPISQTPHLHQPISKVYVEALKEVIRTGTVRNIEFNGENAEGKELILEYTLVPELDQQGKVISVLGVGHDITERKLAEDALLQRDAALKEAQRVGHLGSWHLEIANNRLTWSDEVYRMLEVDPEHFKGTNEAFLDIVYPEDRETLNTAYQNSIQDHVPYSIDHRILLANGQIKYVHEECKTFYDEVGNPVRSIGTILDITDRKQAEEEVRKLNQGLEKRVQERTAQLEASNQELEAFAYSISHDLRAPLRHIDGFLDLLQKRIGNQLDAKSEHYLQTIADSSARMGKLIDDLLQFSRLGRFEMTFAPVDLGELVKDVIQELDADIKGRQIEWKIGELPVVHGNHPMLRDVLVNLISNALKFTRPRKCAQIEITCQVNQQNETIFSIRDNGVGFDMNYADHLFGVFQRLHQAEDFEGTGIGLATVRRIIARHGGRTWAEGKVGQGATFYFSLPKGR